MKFLLLSYNFEIELDEVLGLWVDHRLRNGFRAVGNQLKEIRVGWLESLGILNV